MQEVLSLWGAIPYGASPTLVAWQRARSVLVFLWDEQIAATSGRSCL